MSATLRRPLADMGAIALALVEELRPYCLRCEIAGSIRRKKPEVGDVELVCVPRVEEITVGGELFGTKRLCNFLVQYVGGRLAMQDRFALRLDKNGRPSKGERYMRLSVDSVPLDLFSVLPPAQWGVVFAIRTGPTDFSRKLVTQRLKGGWLANNLRVEDGAVRDGEQIVPCPTEEDFFRCCERPWVAPEERG